MKYFDICSEAGGWDGHVNSQRLQIEENRSVPHAPIELDCFQIVDRFNKETSNKQPLNLYFQTNGWE